MKVKQLKEIIKDLDDDLDVVIDSDAHEGPIYADWSGIGYVVEDIPQSSQFMNAQEKREHETNNVSKILYIWGS